jgi:L-alanine-DL-glutamate epimerase-like enolase superfamily enzyme
MNGIDIAAHDAIGKMLNLSVADPHGGRPRERNPVNASGGSRPTTIRTKPWPRGWNRTRTVASRRSRSRSAARLRRAPRDALFTAPLRYADGILDAPADPGLGVTLDRDALERFRPV